MPRLARLRDPAALLLGAAATYRLTRLAVEDEITSPLRERIRDAAPDGRLAYFVTCPWCVSLWVGAGWALLTVAAPELACAAAAPLAWSAAAGLLASWE